MIKTQNNEIKTQVINRLSRIEGQLRGVQKMIAENRDCAAIVQQLVAIRSALQAASLNFIQEVASDCLHNPENAGNLQTQQEQLADLLNLLGKLVS